MLELVQKSSLGSWQQKAPLSTGRGKGAQGGLSSVLGVSWISFQLLLPMETRLKEQRFQGMMRKKSIMPKPALQMADPPGSSYFSTRDKSYFFWQICPKTHYLEIIIPSSRGKGTSGLLVF